MRVPEPNSIAPSSKSQPYSTRCLPLLGLGPDVLGILCITDRPSHALDQLGRVVVAGQVLRLNILSKDPSIGAFASLDRHHLDRLSYTSVELVRVTCSCQSGSMRS